MLASVSKLKGNIVSRTHFLITQISRICQEICDIKTSKNKYYYQDKDKHNNKTTKDIKSFNSHKMRYTDGRDGWDALHYVHNKCTDSHHDDTSNTQTHHKTTQCPPTAKPPGTHPGS